MLVGKAVHREGCSRIRAQPPWPRRHRPQPDRPHHLSELRLRSLRHRAGRPGECASSGPVSPPKTASPAMSPKGTARRAAGGTTPTPNPMRPATSGSRARTSPVRGRRSPTGERSSRDSTADETDRRSRHGGRVLDTGPSVAPAATPIIRACRSSAARTDPPGSGGPRGHPLPGRRRPRRPRPRSAGRRGHRAPAPPRGDVRIGPDRRGVPRRSRAPRDQRRRLGAAQPRPGPARPGAEPFVADVYGAQRIVAAGVVPARRSRPPSTSSRGCAASSRAGASGSRVAGLDVVRDHRRRVQGARGQRAHPVRPGLRARRPRALRREPAPSRPGSPSAPLGSAYELLGRTLARRRPRRRPRPPPVVVC